MGNKVEVRTLNGDGLFDVYRADPSDTPKAAVVVIQEIFGVNAGIRTICDRWAERGYLALAPDLFWREKRGIELDPDREEELQKAFGHMQALDQNKAIEDIEATIKLARSEGVTKVGAVGYCMGGRLAFMTATRTDSDATVGYYGVMIDNLLGESHGIARSLMLHFAEKDHFVPPAQVETIRNVLKDNARVTIHIYPGVDHGFATESGARRVDAAARLADGRTEAFFKEHLA